MNEVTAGEERCGGQKAGAPRLGWGVRGGRPAEVAFERRLGG